MFYIPELEAKFVMENLFWSLGFVSDLSASFLADLGFRISDFSLSSALGGKISQKRVNYAKRTQFFKKSNVYNLNNNNQLQQKMDFGHLVKTNPNEPNFTAPTIVKFYPS
jgi:hypothetical protein